MFKENLATVVWITDTSASIDDKALGVGWAEFATMVKEAKPERVIYIACDTKPVIVGEYTPDDIPATPPKHVGGGGTLFQPAFDLISKFEEPPACAIYYSADLENYDRDLTQPDYPTLWVTGINVRREGPFGNTVRIDPWAL
jgi:predicted metal-dependent peptidase